MDGSIALGLNGDVLSVERFDTGASHAAQLMSRLSDAAGRLGLDPLNLGEVHVSAGPGSFTGLRIAGATARMLALATGAHLTRVDTLQVIAHNALCDVRPPARLAVMLDAKRGNVYVGLYEYRPDGDPPGYAPLTAPVETAPQVFLAGVPCDTSVIGAGAMMYRHVIESSGFDILPESLFRPQAQVVLSLGHAMAQRGMTTPARDFVPIYVRRPEAEERWEQRHAS